MFRRIPPSLCRLVCNPDRFARHNGVDSGRASGAGPEICRRNKQGGRSGRLLDHFSGMTPPEMLNGKAIRRGPVEPTRSYK